jgi:predicted transcriptional regulator
MFDITQLKSVRKQLNLTQNQFAKNAGVSQSLIAKIESGKIDPTYSKVQKIESVLNKISQEHSKTAKDIMIQNLISVKPDLNIIEIIKLLNEHAISQILVSENENVKGIIYEAHLLEKITEKSFSSYTAKDIMIEAPPLVSEESKIPIVSSLLKFYPLILVSKKGKVIGVITKSDLLKSLL